MSLEALERRLGDAPDDAEAWLVYADALLADGDVRGDLVRLELEHAAAPNDNQRKRRLHVEARTLIKQHEATWRGGLSEDATVSWKHGFVTGVWLPWEPDSVASLARFVNGPHARLLGTVGFRWDRRPDDALAQTLVKELAALSLPTVRTLALAYVGLSQETVQALAQVKCLPTLRHLDLRYAELGDAGLSALLDDAPLTQLTHLSLQKNGLTALSATRLARARLASLRELDLRLNFLGPEGALELARAPWAPHLETLHLYGGDVGREGLRTIARTAGLPLALRRTFNAFATAAEPA